MHCNESLAALLKTDLTDGEDSTLRFLRIYQTV